MSSNASVEYSLRDGFARALSTLLATALFGFMTTAEAATINIVALGASNTAGKGAESGTAWPAQLTSMLRAKGYDVKLIVVGMLGATSDAIMNRVDSAVPPGTQIVIFDTGEDNDRKRGMSESNREATIAQIESRIRARGASPLRLAYLGIPSSMRQGDGIHLNSVGHMQVATLLLPRVIAAMGERR